jgi:uncharacterized membrane protein YraQ (UPF0718 family)
MQLSTQLLSPHLVCAVGLPGALDDIGRSLKESFLMFWETLWPLLLGFGLSGAVQRFVSRSAMERKLGNHRPLALLRASGYGMASSSCSYAASAMAKSLIEKGADFVSAMVFMFASTNLVVELGIVLAVLVGWQFTAAEFVGGPIMIVLLAAFGSLLLSPKVVAGAQRRLSSRMTPDRSGKSSSHQDQSWHCGQEKSGPGTDEGVDHCRGAGTGRDSERTGRSLLGRLISDDLRSATAWSEAAGYSLADLKMLRKEMGIGYIVAGFLATLVPASAWSVLFAHGHGIWTSIENALVGPVIAFASFVCSIGNVPLAAALWKGGISFGGVVSFIFGDLITAPLVMIYRRYYGGTFTLRLVGIFWVVMSLAGLAVQVIFSAAGIMPTHHQVHLASAPLAWDHTTVLNLLFLALFSTALLMRRTRRDISGSDLAVDPICGMQVRKSDAPVRIDLDGKRYWFCSERCGERFAESSPGSQRTSAATTPQDHCQSR